MKALIEIEGDSHRVITAAALCGVLTKGHDKDDLVALMALREFRNFAEALGGEIEDGAADGWVEVDELKNALTGLDYLRGLIVAEIEARQTTETPS
jgi:hypothetical protein